MRHGKFIELHQGVLDTLRAAKGKDKYHIAAACGLLSLDGRPVKLTKDQQTAIFGAYIFGKQNLLFDSNGQGTLVVWASACFGTDSNSSRWTFEEAARAAREGTDVKQ